MAETNDTAVDEAEDRRIAALTMALQYFAESEDVEGVIVAAAAFEAYLKDGTVPSEDDD